jgi:hypothetical protein
MIISLRLFPGHVNDLQLGYARQGEFETYLPKKDRHVSTTNLIEYGVKILIVEKIHKKDL